MGTRGRREGGKKTGMTKRNCRRELVVSILRRKEAQTEAGIAAKWGRIIRPRGRSYGPECSKGAPAMRSSVRATVRAREVGDYIQKNADRGEGGHWKDS